MGVSQCRMALKEGRHRDVTAEFRATSAGEAPTENVP